MATRTTRTTRRPGSPTTSRAKKPTAAQSVARSFSLPPHVARSLIGLSFLVLGAITVIALLFPQAGLLNRYVDEILRPAFGQGAWLLALLLIVAGVVIERPPAAGYGSMLTIIGGLLVFAAGLGMIHLIWGHGATATSLRGGGGLLGEVTVERADRARLVDRRLRRPARTDRCRPAADVQHVAARAAQSGHGRWPDAGRGSGKRERRRSAGRRSNRRRAGATD